jgi:hypothetical protein
MLIINDTWRQGGMEQWNNGTMEQSCFDFGIPFILLNLGI